MLYLSIYSIYLSLGNAVLLIPAVITNLWRVELEWEGLQRKKLKRGGLKELF
jgi:hypothetical protein